MASVPKTWWLPVKHLEHALEEAAKLLEDIGILPLDVALNLSASGVLLDDFEEGFCLSTPIHICTESTLYE